MRTLVVTGDDFGFSKAVNRGIAEAYDHGILTSASLMITGDAVGEAIALARARPGLAVGLHLVIVDGRSALGPAEIPALVGADGSFRGGPVSAGLRYQFSGAARRQLVREIRAQLERFEETGLTLSHVDGHHHMHLHPVALEALIDLAREFGIPLIRLPSEELGVALDLDRRDAASKVLWSGIFGRLRRFGESRLRARGIGFAERVYGLLQTGRVTEDYLLGLIPRIQAARVELYCHPAAGLEGLSHASPAAPGEEELAALTSARVREAVTRSGLILSKSVGNAATSAS